MGGLGGGGELKPANHCDNSDRVAPNHRRREIKLLTPDRFILHHRILSTYTRIYTSQERLVVTKARKARGGIQVGTISVTRPVTYVLFDVGRDQKREKGLSWVNSFCVSYIRYQRLSINFDFCDPYNNDFLCSLYRCRYHECV